MKHYRTHLAIAAVAAGLTGVVTLNGVYALAVGLAYLVVAAFFAEDK